MKRLAIVLLCLVCCLLVFVACKTKEETPVDLVEVPPSVPADTCEHEWDLTAFVTEETTVAFAGEFTCKKCQKQEVRSFSYTDIDIPLINIEGDISEISKENKVNVNITCQSDEKSFSSAATMKLQGNSSLSWPKNNFSITLRDDAFDKKKSIVIKEEWGAQSKYCLKSNYVDPTFCRNLVTSDLYGQIAETRNVQDEFSDLVNYGAVDGFMILLYINSKYQGVYNCNIPKDKWLFDMGDDDAGEAVLCGNSNLLCDDGITLDQEAKSFWEVEYCNDKYSNNGDQWAVDSFNEMLRFSINAGVSEFRENASRYINVGRAIDTILLACVFCQRDNIYANLVFCTYDATHWTPILYDLDETFGRDAGDLVEREGFPDCSVNPIYNSVLVAFYPELKARYFALRESIMTTENIMSLFAEKMAGLDERYFQSEESRWRNGWQKESASGDIMIDSFESELAYINDYIDARLAFCDSVFSTEDPLTP